MGLTLAGSGMCGETRLAQVGVGFFGGAGQRGKIDRSQPRAIITGSGNVFLFMITHSSYIL